MADTQGHQLRMKNGKWDSRGAENQHEATVGQPLLVSCISQGTNPTPNLTMFINDQPLKEASATARVQDLTMGVPTGMKVTEGRLDMVYDSMFGSNNMMTIECKAYFNDYLIETEHLSLRKKNNQVEYFDIYEQIALLQEILEEHEERIKTLEANKLCCKP